MTVSLVLLPGLDGTGKLFGPLLEELPSDIQPIVVRYPAEPLGYRALKALVLDLLPSDKPFVLLAESFSGPVAVLTAAEKPPGLLGLVLCGSFVVSPHRWIGSARFLLELVPIRFAARTVGARVLIGRFEVPGLAQLMSDALAQVPSRVLRARLRAALRVDVRAELSAIEVPSLYLQASEDRIVPKTAAEAFARSAQRGKVQVVAAPHFLLQCAPSNAARSIQEFIRAHRGAA